MMAFARRVALPLLFVGFASLPGCDEAAVGCTEIGCGPALEVDFSPPPSQPGDYALDVTADGVSASCTVTLPFAGCNEPVTCVPADPGFYVESSGCALPASEHRILGVLWPTSGPTTVTVAVSRDGNLLASGAYTPTYATSRPNGPDCEPVCVQAQAPTTLAIP